MYDIITFKSDKLTIETNGERNKSFKINSVTKKGARLFKDKKVFSGSFVGDITDRELLKQTEENSKVGLDCSFEQADASTFDYVQEGFDTFDPMSLKDDVKKTQELISDYHKDYLFNGTFTVTKNHETLVSGNGINHSVKKYNYDCYYIFKEKGSPNLMDGYFGSSGTKFEMETAFKSFRPYLDKFKNKIELPDGEYPIVIADDDSSWYYKLLESFYADKYYEGSALYSGKLGKKLFSDKLSLYDERYNPEYGMTAKYDDEGTQTEWDLFPLIEKGVMKNVIADKRLAQKYKIKSTGNGLRGYATAPSTSFHKIVFGKGNRTFNQILSGMEKCLVVFMAHGGDFTDKGEFSTPIHLGYLVEKGNIIGRLPQLTLITTLDKMFGENLIEFSSDNFWGPSSQVNLFHKVKIINN